jgi:hypothetical protein
MVQAVSMINAVPAEGNRPYPILATEDALSGISQCASVLDAIMLASDDLADEARKQALQLVSTILAEHTKTLQSCFDRALQERASK